MPYLGNDPGKLGTVLMDSFTGNGSTVAFTLIRQPPNADALIVAVDGVVQHPTGAWSVSTNTLTFSTAPDSGAEIRVWHLSSSNTVDTVEDNAITLAKMAGGTDGNIISYDASGDPVAIATGDEGEVLTSAGEGAPPAFAAAAAGGGLTEADSWRLTTGFTGDADPIASNLARWSATGFGLLGTGMSQSAGIFTFPSTGYWAVLAQFSFGYAGDSRYCQGYIEVTVDADAGNTYSTLTMNGTSMTQIASETMSGALVVYGLVDVTSVAAVKVRFKVSVYDDSVDVIGGTANSTSFHFLKLGDT